MAGGAREPCAGCGGVTGRVERRTRDARRAELEAARIDVARGVAARAVAVEAAERNVVARIGDEGDVAERSVHRRAVAGEAARHALVGAGDRVERVVARGGVALRAGRAGRDMVRRLGASGLIGGKDGGGGVAAGAAVARGWMGLVERRRTR